MTENMLKGKFSKWLPLISLTLATFVINTAECLPIGLLSSISEDFGISEARGGLLISVYAWVVALISVPLMLLFAKVNLRKLLLYTLLVFALCHVLSTFSNSFGFLLASRVGIACAHAVFWSIVSPLSTRIAPDGKGAVGLSMVMAGTAIALIVGMPVGRMIGLHAGWRMAFGSIAIAASATFLLLLFVFPKVQNNGSFKLRELPALLKNPALLGIYLMTIVVVSAHYTGYSYIEPFMLQVAELGENTVTLALMIFGFAGIIGSYLFAKHFDRHEHLFIGMAVGGIAVSLLLLNPSAVSVYTLIALFIIWGTAFTSLDLVFSAEVIKVVPQADMIAMALYSSIFNIGIACGSLAGGAVCTVLSISMTSVVGGVIGLLGLVYCLKRLTKLL